ncbi:hypothetical protein OX284_008575 [Flavobacterium sp. SUN046]|uniref:hypothetical protein n=1 Tax=Flavobacterium sp. SUN046 TaxID=3002440 RepID=UPI002DB825DC|nr:hypothetical protein [Flavobacterium sp. SUN046]MEC4049482.1 hypothetical protein [Flavobacterium sp. SUN046]
MSKIKFLLISKVVVMARKKLGRVLVLEKGRTRLAGVKSISPTLDLGNDVTAENYEAVIESVETKVSLYNTHLSTVDDLYNACMAEIEILKDWNDRILSGVKSKYGTDSSEYEMAGGVRKSERKKPRRSQK